MISTKGRYALRVMIDLAEQAPEAFIPLDAIAALSLIHISTDACAGIPLPFLCSPHGGPAGETASPRPAAAGTHERGRLPRRYPGAEWRRCV